MSHAWREHRGAGWPVCLAPIEPRGGKCWNHRCSVLLAKKSHGFLRPINWRNIPRAINWRSIRLANVRRNALRVGAALLLTLPCLPPRAIGEEAPIPAFEQLEAEGAIIGEIRINNRNIFDLDDPRENSGFYRFANTLHIRTRPSVIRRALLFKSGDPVVAQVMEESERLLYSSGFLYAATIRPITYHDGIVDVEVVTKDTWTLDPGLGFSRTGGDNRSSFGLSELNLLGTGIAIGYKQRDVEGVNTELFEYNQPQLFGTRAVANYIYETFEDGDRQLLSVIRPFYRLDARWSAGVSAGTSEVLAATYQNNIVTGEYRVKSDFASVFGGWSKGLIEGWTRRYTIGLDYIKSVNSPEPGLKPPDNLPDDGSRVSPYFRFDIIEDNFAKLTNRDLIERAEYFQLGFRANLKLGYAATALGSTQPGWSYTAAISNGVTLADEKMIVGAAEVAGFYTDGDEENALVSGGLKYYIPRSDRSLTFFGLAGGYAYARLVSTQLTLGGNNGLPGYPTDHQRGNRRVLLNFEQRIYTDWYPFRLFHVGGAVFFNAGSAWGDDAADNSKPKWLADVGAGLRIFGSRSAFGTVWHLDLAFPIDPDENVPSYQVLVVRRTGF